MTERNSQAVDPGFRLFQIRDVQWVHCPRCDGPAKLAGGRLTCIKCAYVEGGPKPGRRRMRQVMLTGRLNCANSSCGAPIPSHGRPVRGGGSAELMAEVKCPTCGEVRQYPAAAVEPVDVAKAHAALRRFRPWPNGAPYLTRRIGDQVLVVYNRTHLEALEQWLGAKHRLRPRAGVPGLTMMARLPRWMKAASARREVLKALAELREQAEREGLW